MIRISLHGKIWQNNNNHEKIYLTTFYKPEWLEYFRL